jgi:hypothetical protein
MEDHPELEDRDQVLQDLGMDDELLWDVLYHQTVSLDEALRQVENRLTPAWTTAYVRFFSAEGERLRSGGYASDAAALSVGELRECLLVMTASRVATGIEGLHAVVDWHPTLVKFVAAYLASLEGASPGEEVADFLRARIDLHLDSDLELAWLISSAMGKSGVVTNLEGSLQELTRTPDMPLCAAYATRVLASVGLLDDQTWEFVLRVSPTAIRAELLLAREAEPGLFPSVDSPVHKLK